MQNRRDFLSQSATFMLATGTALAAPVCPHSQEAPCHTDTKDRFRVGIAGYSLRDFSIEETLYWLQRWDLRAWAVKDVHLPLDSDAARILAFRKTCEAANVEPYAAGVIYMKTAAEVTRAFSYAERLGTRLIIGVPELRLLGEVEKAVKATGIRLAIHNHGPDLDIFATPQSVFERIKEMDTRIGLCVDIGHTQRCGIDPSDALLTCGDRVFDVHIKDVDKASKEGKTVALGHGIIDIHRLMRTLRKQGFTGVCGLEFESGKAETLPGLSETLGYLRGVLDSL